MQDINEGSENISQDISNDSQDRLPENAPFNPHSPSSADLSISFKTEYKKEELKQKLTTFKAASVALTTEDLQKSAHNLHKLIKKSDKIISARTGKLFSISLIEHSHYIYAFRQLATNTSQEDINLLEMRTKQFGEHEYPREEFYESIQEVLRFLSQLLCKWNVFDINDYGYRYKGRSLTVKVIDMRRINEQCLTAEICWFSYAIMHQPFFGKIEKIVMCFAQVLQKEIERAIVFLRNNDLEEMEFEIRPWWRCGRRNEVLTTLLGILKGIEAAYRHFERSLIEVFLKIV